VEQRVYLSQSFLTGFGWKESGGPAGFLKEQAGFIDLSLGDHLPVNDTNSVFLGGQLGRCGQTANDRSLILGGTGSLGCKGGRCEEGSDADENHFHQFEVFRRLKLE
jgi:hypothetical protein